MNRFSYYNQLHINKRFNYENALDIILQQLAHFKDRSIRTSRLIENFENECRNTKNLLNKLATISLPETNNSPPRGSFEAQPCYNSWHYQLTQALRLVARLLQHMESNSLEKIGNLTRDDIDTLNTVLQTVLLDYIIFKKHVPCIGNDEAPAKDLNLEIKYSVN